MDMGDGAQALGREVLKRTPRVVCVGSSDWAIRRPGTFANSNMFARPLGASARDLVRALEKAGLDVIRQRGSDITLHTSGTEKTTGGHGPVALPGINDPAALVR
jgi:predicted RNA binding protein YcfA (HicA-like mRNA interferase family)